MDCENELKNKLLKSFYTFLFAVKHWTPRTFFRNFKEDWICEVAGDMSGSVSGSGGGGGGALEQGLEVSTAQEELVRLNLHVKSLNSRFESVFNHKEMTELNTEIRRQIEAMRRLLKVLRDLAVTQKDPNLAKMLMNDVENHTDQIVALQTSFKQANMRCISRLDARSGH